MSGTDHRTEDPAKPHPSENMGHEMSDFSWTTVLWFIPISIIVLVTFTVVSLYWFRGVKDDKIQEKQSLSSTTELDLQHAKENEILNGYKWVDQEKGRVRIPIQRAMELMVQENQASKGLDWKPITDIYLLGAAFKGTEAGERAGAPAPAASLAPEAANSHAEEKPQAPPLEKNHH